MTMTTGHAPMLLLLALLMLCSCAMTNAESLDHQPQERNQRSLLQQTTLPFLLVWRLEINSNFDRQPTMYEYGGVAQATAQWLTTTVPASASFDHATTSLVEVSTAVRTASWDPQRSVGPHTIRLDCEVVVEDDKYISMDLLRAWLDDIGSNDLATFVHQYVRVIGPSSSVFKHTKQSATYVTQTSSNIVGAGITDKDRQPVDDSTMLTADGGGMGTTHGDDMTPTESPTTSPTRSPTNQPTNAATIVATAGDTSASSGDAVSFTVPVKLSYGVSSINRPPTQPELDGLLDNTVSFLETSLQGHYGSLVPPPQVGFVGVTMEWTAQSYDPATSRHELGADIHVWYETDVGLPSTNPDHYIHLLTSLLGGSNTANYIFNYVHTAEPTGSSVFGSVNQFAFDF